MLKFRCFYVLLFVNFLASISLILFVYLTRNDENVSFYVIPMYIGWILLMLGSLVPLLIISIGHLRNAVALFKVNDTNGLRRGMKRMKLASIPYFIANFLYFAVLALLAFAVSRGFVIFTPIPLIFALVMIFTYIVMLFTSIYGLVYIVTLKKNESMKWFSFFIHIVLHLVFVLDILDTIILLSWYPKDEKHGWKRTLITLAAIITILFLVGGLVWRDLTSPMVDTKLEDYPGKDLYFAKEASILMPALSQLSDSTKLQFENRAYQMGIVSYQSAVIIATYDQQTYIKAKTKLDNTYDFLAKPIKNDEENYSIPAIKFSIADYNFRVIDPPGDEQDAFPNLLWMVATSDKTNSVVYLFCEDEAISAISDEAGASGMVKYVEQRYPHFWE